MPLQEQLKLLYVQAGMEEGLLSLLTAFYNKMQHDTMLGFFFSGRDLRPIVLMQQSFLLRAMGRPVTYSGKAPGSAHKQIPPILQGHFDRRLVLLKETLTEGGLEASAIDCWISFEEQFRKSIVEEEAPISQRKERKKHDPSFSRKK